MPALKILTIFAWLIALTPSVYADPHFDEEFDDEAKPWQEIAIQLPALPQSENLVSFYVSPTTRLSFAIDSKSLTVNTDGVIRYTLVTKSASGAENISYEGLRCVSYEVKLYAFGHKDGTWSRSRRDKWQPIKDNATNRQHAALAQYYFCDLAAIAGSPKDMLYRMRWQQPLDNNPGSSR